MAGTCAFCGSKQKLTRDHIPPACIFAPSLPQNVITVPACERCNQGTSKDDEYFRTALLFSAFADGAEASNGWEVARRSLERPQAVKFRHHILQSIVSANVVTQHGLFLGTRPAMQVDINRINRTIRKIVRGLHFGLTGKRLGENLIIRSRWFEEITEDFQKHVVQPLSKLEFSRIGEKTFSYRYFILPSSVSIWQVRFFDNLSFYCAANVDNRA